MVRTPPGSLSEGAGSPQGLTEGVSSDGCFGPMVYSQVFIGSEIHVRLRSSKYTPSVSLSLDSSLREGAGRGCTTHRTARKPKSFGRFSSPLRKLKAVLCYYNSADSRGGNLRNKCFTTCLICTGGCVRLVRCLPFGPAGGLRYCRRLQWQTVDCPLRRISPNQSLQVLRC